MIDVSSSLCHADLIELDKKRRRKEAKEERSSSKRERSGSKPQTTSEKLDKNLIRCISFIKAVTTHKQNDNPICAEVHSKN